MSRCVLVTGASGYVGGLIAAALLASEDGRLVLPVRGHHDRDQLTSRIVGEASSLRPDISEPTLLARARERVTWVRCNDVASLPRLQVRLADWGVSEVIHALGCLDYFDETTLHATNVRGTESVVALCRANGGLPLTYISSAFASGYRDHPIPETLHTGDCDDPTAYTASKRLAELAVAESGLPWLILRPTVMIGDSQDGHYSGKTYGLYQLWNGIERLLLTKRHSHFDIAAPEIPVPLLHQDHWQQAFLAVRAQGLRERVVHVASRHDVLPTKCALWDLWMQHCFHPDSVRYVPDMASLPLHTMDRRQRALMALASVNVEIASRAWRFETQVLAELRVEPEATLESVWVCQRRFMAASARLQAYVARHAPQDSAGRGGSGHAASRRIQ